MLDLLALELECRNATPIGLVHHRVLYVHILYPCLNCTLQKMLANQFYLATLKSSTHYLLECLHCSYFDTSHFLSALRDILSPLYCWSMWLQHIVFDTLEHVVTRELKVQFLNLFASSWIVDTLGACCSDGN